MSNITRIDVTLESGAVFGDSDMTQIDRQASEENLEAATLNALTAAYPEAEIGIDWAYDAGRHAYRVETDDLYVTDEQMDTIREICGRAWDGGAWIVMLA